MPRLRMFDTMSNITQHIEYIVCLISTTCRCDRQVFCLALRGKAEASEIAGPCVYY